MEKLYYLQQLQLAAGALTAVIPLIARIAVLPLADVFVKVILVKILVLKGAFKVIWLSYNLGFSALPENTSGNCEPMVVLVTLPIPLIAKFRPSNQSGTEKLAMVLVPSLKFNVTLNEEEPQH